MSEEVARDAIKVIVNDKDGTQLLETPYFAVNFAVLYAEQFAVDGVVNEEHHVLGLRLNGAWRVKLGLHQFDFRFDVFKVFLGKRLVFEH